MQVKKRFEDLKILLFFFREHKISAGYVFLMMVLSSVFESVNVAALYPVINYGLKMDGGGQGLKWLEFVLHSFRFNNLFLGSCLLLIAITMVATSLKIYYHYLSNKLIMRIIAENQNSIFQKLASMEYKYFVKSQQGKLIYASTVAPIGISSNIFSAVRSANSFVTILFLATLMMFLTWQGMVFVIVLGIFYIFFVRKILNHFVRQFSHLSVEEDEKKNIILNEFISGIKSIKAFHVESLWQERFSQSVLRSAQFRFQVVLGHVLPDSFLKFIFFSGIGLMGLALGFSNTGNMMSLLPALGTFAIVASRIIPYINLFGNDIVAVARYMPDMKIVYDLLHEQMAENWTGTKALGHFQNKIQFRDVWFKYDGAANFLFKGLNFSIEKGKVTAVVGPSGAGKSTIINLLLSLFSVAKGEILLDGINIKEFSRESYLQKVGYISQETFIFNGTIRDNICFGLSYSDEEIIAAAQLANAHEFILAAEKGYDTIVGDAGIKLSGGQRQRLAIARAMLRRPEILILDEATSSLDNVSERQVQQAINNIAHRTTVFLVAHRLSTVQNADKIVVLEHGQIAEEGTHEQLIKNRRAYFQLYTTTQIGDEIKI